MENISTPPQKPLLVDGPPTVEYIETKRNWKKIFEICAVIIIISIPLILSLFKIDYSVKSAYEVVNPAYVGTSSDYGTWGNIVTVAKKFIQPVIQLTPQPTATPTLSPVPPAMRHQQEVQQPQHSEQSVPAQDQNWAQYQYPSQVNDSPLSYPPDVQMQEPTSTPTDIPTSIPTPTFRPTSTPTPTFRPTSTPTPRPTMTPSPAPNNDQIDVYAAYTACYGKKNNAACSYQSSYGGIVNGKCKTSTEGYLTCGQ